MEVTTIGGGPGGLYASLLLKKSNPEWSITVHERNPKDVTYGWGIVLPGRTFSNLEDADEVSYKAIQERSSQWNPFDIYLKGKRYRSDGHTFLSIMRSDLLDILQERCMSLGVDVRFESEISDPEEVNTGSDFVIAADGIHSGVRQSYSEEFGTSTVTGKTRFSWFGTDRDFDALSHIFVENDAGYWCAHTYPGRTSTFIVDCDAETWANSGLERMTESEYLDYLEALFADYLDGSSLLSQQDRWQRFTTVSNDKWYHRNTVLIGDAAHTAHYSIGSGTTLAIEDAIALANVLEDTEQVDEDSLSRFQRARKPTADRLQVTGERSRIHFENISRFIDLDPWQFVVHHLTRSGRITYGSLSKRDSSFMNSFDDWFTSSIEGAEDSQTGLDQGPAVTGLRLTDTEFENRFVRVANPTFESVDGYPSDRILDSYTSLDRNQPGMVLTEPIAVSQTSRPTGGSPGMYNERHTDRWQQAVDNLNEGSATIAGIHLIHAGSVAAKEADMLSIPGPVSRDSAWASPLRSEFPTPPHAFEPEYLTDQQADSIRDEFVAAASRSDRAGFDHLQINATQGSVLGQYLSYALEHDRNVADEWVIDTIAAINDEWPSGKSLGVTLGLGRTRGNFDKFGKYIEISEILSKNGAQMITPVPPDTRGDSLQAEIHGASSYCDNVRNGANVATLTGSQIHSVDKVNTLVGTGRADLCVFHGDIPD